MSSTCPVQVVVRTRPLNDRERSENARNVFSFPSKKEIAVSLKGKNVTKTYTFDTVYPPESTQEEVYESTVRPIVEEALKGFNCTIFAYGQTGTGKTFTMEGLRNAHDSLDHNINPQSGIIPRAIHQIFRSLEASDNEYTVRVSFLELYNEELGDLLGSGNEQLKIFEDPFRKGVTVYGLEEVPVNNAQDIFKILDKGLKMRQTAETNLNKNSSRSHCIFSVIIHTKEATPDGEELLKVGKLNLVDLAGSENVGRSGAQKERKREAGSINQSLLVLGKVITALTEHCPHVPYRESKLTRLLQDSLGGKTKTCIIATVSPSNVNMEETISTLDYAHRAKNIRNRPEVNQKMTKKALIREYIQEIEKLRANLAAARDKDGFYITKESYEDMESQIAMYKKQLADLDNQVKGHEAQLKETQDKYEMKRAELETTEKLFKETKVVLENTKEQLSQTLNDLDNTRQIVEEQSQRIEEQEETQLYLKSKAESYYEALHTTVADVDGLHSKIERKTSVEEENKRKIAQFQMYVMNRVNKSQEELRKFQAEQTASFKRLVDDINTFKDNTTKELEELRATVEAQMKLITASLQHASSSVHNSSSVWFQQLTTQQAAIDTFQTQFTDDLVGIKSEMSDFFSSLKEDKSTGLTPKKRWGDKENQPPLPSPIKLPTDSKITLRSKSKDRIQISL